VSGAGMIGFIGLVVPHFARKRVGALHRGLIPLAALWGATTLVASDLLARWVARPQELPVGVVTALLGAPCFIFLMTTGEHPRVAPAVAGSTDVMGERLAHVACVVVSYQRSLSQWRMVIGYPDKPTPNGRHPVVLRAPIGRGLCAASTRPPSPPAPW
jgi:hypothetical protein